MHVISRKALRDFCERHAAAERPLEGWFRAATKGRFANLEELKQTFGSVDYVRLGMKRLYVFNIAGNNYRLVAAIHFDQQRLYVRHLLTHAEYDRGSWKI